MTDTDRRDSSLDILLDTVAAMCTEIEIQDGSQFYGIANVQSVHQFAEDFGWVLTEEMRNAPLESCLCHVDLPAFLDANLLRWEYDTTYDLYIVYGVAHLEA